MKVFFNLLAIQTILNLYIFYKGWIIIPPRYSKLRSFYIGIFVFEILTYAVAFIWNDTFSPLGYKILLNLCSGWAFWVLYMALILLAIDFCRLLVRLSARLFKKHISKYSSMLFRRITFAGTFIASLTIMSIGYYNFLHPIKNERNITINKEIKPMIPNPLKIVMFSDSHLGYINGSNILSKYIDLIMEQKPDLILIGGDIIDYSLRPILKDQMTEQFNRLEALMGVYTCLGNHDHYADGEEKIRWLKEKSGITVLQDSVVMIDSTLYIIGREDFKSPRKKLSELTNGLDNRYPIFVLNHQPKDLEEEVSSDVDLALYGHTHDGQFFPFTQILRGWYELSAGYMKKNNTHIFVSSGLGGIPQLRIDSRSEIIIVNCTFTTNQN